MAPVDNTKEKEAEEKLRKAMDSMKAAKAKIDALTLVEENLVLFF